MADKTQVGLSYIERETASNPFNCDKSGGMGRMHSLFTRVRRRWMGVIMGVSMGVIIGFIISLQISLALALMIPAHAQPASGDPAPIHLVALGDSLTAGYGLAPQDGFTAQLQTALLAKGHRVIVHNGGVSGDTSAGGLARLDWVVNDKTQAVIVELGANDMLRGLSPQMTEKNLRQIIETLQARGLKVMLAGMLAAPNLGPAYERAFNGLYPRLAKQYGLVFYPFFLEGVAGDPKLNLGDRIHPNRDGVEVIVENITPVVEQLLARIEQ